MLCSRFRCGVWTAISCCVFMSGCGCDTIHYNSKIRVSNASDVPANVAVELLLYDLGPAGEEWSLISSASANVPQAYPPHVAGEQAIPQINMQFDSSKISLNGATLKCQLSIEFGGSPVVSKEFDVGHIPPAQGDYDFSKDFRINIEPTGNVNFYEVASTRTGGNQSADGISVPVRIVLTETTRSIRRALPNRVLP